MMMRSSTVLAIFTVLVKIAASVPASYPMYPYPPEYDYTSYGYPYTSYSYPYMTEYPYSSTLNFAPAPVLVEDVGPMRLDNSCLCSKPKTPVILEESQPVAISKPARDVNLLEDKNIYSPSAMASAQTVVNVGMAPAPRCRPCAEPAVVMEPTYYDKPLYAPYYRPQSQAYSAVGQ